MMWKHAVRCRLLIKIMFYLWLCLERLQSGWPLIPITNTSKPKTAGNALHQIFLVYFVLYGSHELRQVWFTTCHCFNFCLTNSNLIPFGIWSFKFTLGLYLQLGLKKKKKMWWLAGGSYWQEAFDFSLLSGCAESTTEHESESGKSF